MRGNSARHQSKTVALNSEYSIAHISASCSMYVVLCPRALSQSHQASAYKTCRGAYHTHIS